MARLHACWHRVFFAATIALAGVSGFETHNNGVVGEPKVDCGVEAISIWVKTQSSFHGRLYVEEEIERPECTHNYHADGGPLANGYDPSSAEFVVKFGQCNMRRQRVLNPRGVSYGFTLVVSFHPVFLTGIDRAFNVKCFFMEAVRAIDVALDVSPLTPALVASDFSLPRCSYHLKQGYDGPYVKFANIVAGWIYGVLIHTCYVDDGHGNRFDLIDERGCPIDRYLLAEVRYEEREFGAYANTHVFRYANRIQLYFTCTLQLCFKEDGGCEGITPPLCNGHGGHSGHGPPSSGRGGDGPPHRLHHAAAGPVPPKPPRIKPPLVAGPPPATKNFFRRLLRGDNDKPSSRHSPSLPPFPFPPFKDSPLALNESDDQVSFLLQQQQNLTNNLANATNVAIRKSRRDIAEWGGRLETDLTAELSVMPLNSSVAAGAEEDELKKERSSSSSHKIGHHHTPTATLMATVLFSGGVLLTLCALISLAAKKSRRCTRRK